MTSCACISISLHMTIKMAMLIKTLKDLSSDLCWCSFNIFSTQYHTKSAIMHDESDDVFSWKGESLEEYWDCILISLIWPQEYFKGNILELVIDDESEMTLISMRVRRQITLGDFQKMQYEKLDIENRKEADFNKKKNRNVYFCVAYSQYLSTSIHRVIIVLKKTLLTSHG